jgi:PKD repeat protein
MHTPLSRPLALLLGPLLALVACSDSRRSAPATASLIPAFDVQVVADRYTGVVGTTFQLTASSQSGRTPIRWDWQFGDGSTATGASVSVTYAAAGSFVSTVTGTDASGRTVAGEMLSTVFTPGAASVGPLGVPRAALPGDADEDGSLSLRDALRCARVAARSQAPVDSGEVLRLDATLDGRIDASDVDAIAGALVAGAARGEGLLPERGAPGRVVRMTAPALLDPAARFRVQIGDGDPVLLDRSELGFGSFVIPPSLAAGAVEVALLDDVGVVTTFTFDVLPAYQTSAAPGTLFARLDQLTAASRPLARAGLVDYLAASGLPASDQAILTALWDVSAAEIVAKEQNVRLVMAQLPPEVVALLERIAVANGMLEQIESGEELLGGAPGTAPLLLGDTGLAALCWFANYKSSAINTTAGFASTACEWGGTAAAIVLGLVAVGTIKTGVISAAALTALAGLVNACLAVSVPLAVNEVVAELAPDMKLSRLSVTADPAVLNPPSVLQSQLRVSLTVPVDPSLCGGAGKLSELVAKKAIEKVLTKVPLTARLAKLIKLLPENVQEQLLGPLVDLVAASVGFTVNNTGLGTKLNEVGMFLCQLGTAFGATLDPNGVLSGPVPNIGTLQLAPPGTEEPSIYTGDPNQPATVTFTASKTVCGMALTATAQVSYGLRPVTITMGDNGAALDDIYAVEIEGDTVLTSSVPVVQTSTVVQLTVGDHVVVMRGLAAPDGIGTYYIQFSGASVLPGSNATSGTDLVPGTFKTFNIRVQ